MRRQREGVQEDRPLLWRQAGAGAYLLKHFSHPRDLIREVDHHIYVLRDPRDGGVRYVGRTKNQRRRYEAHLYGTDDGSFVTAKRDWISELREAGQRPRMEVVEVLSAPVAEALVSEREHRWMFHLFQQGARLTNVDCVRMPRLYAAARASRVNFLNEPLGSAAWEELALLRKIDFEEWMRTNRALWDELESRRPQEVGRMRAQPADGERAEGSTIKGKPHE